METRNFADLFVKAFDEKLDELPCQKMAIDTICGELKEFAAPLAELYKVHPKEAKDLIEKLDMSRSSGSFDPDSVIQAYGWCITARGYDSWFSVSIDIDCGDYHFTNYGRRRFDAPSFYVTFSTFKADGIKASLHCDADKEYRIIPCVLEAWQNGIETEVFNAFCRLYTEALK